MKSYHNRITLKVASPIIGCPEGLPLCCVQFSAVEHLCLDYKVVQREVTREMVVTAPNDGGLWKGHYSAALWWVLSGKCWWFMDRVLLYVRTTSSLEANFYVVTLEPLE